MKKNIYAIIFAMETIIKNTLIRYPFLLKPAICKHIWGGTRLIEEYHKKTPNKTLSETWEVSINPEYPSIIDNGIYKGIPLRELIEEYPEILGKHLSEFSLLIKLIDAKSKLSVQVHPDDKYARIKEGQKGKTEAWYILDTDEDAYIYLGFAKETTKEEFEQAIINGTVEKLLNKIPVRVGQSFIVPAGTVHAIGEGVTLLEIQENSSLTYRAYDYNRVDVDGKQRELHIDKALEVTNLKEMDKPNFKQFYTYLHGKRVKVIAMCDYFTSYLVKRGLSFGFQQPTMISIIGGTGTIITKGESFEVTKGDSLFLPAGLNCRVMGSIKYVLTIEGDK